MYTIENERLRYTVDGDGNAVSFFNKLTNREYIFSPGNIWKIIYCEGERKEIPVESKNQSFTADVADDAQSMVLTYEKPQGDGRALDLHLIIRFCLRDNGMNVKAAINMHGEESVPELQLTCVSNVRSVSGNPGEDTLTWPYDLGRKVENPAYSDLSTFSGFRKYERHDQNHTDMDNIYPGRLGMQWYDLFCSREGIYVGMHNASYQTISLHIERDVKDNVLRLGGIFFPFLKQNESWESEPLVYNVHEGDWHAGAKMYRQWLETSGWRAPNQPEYIKRFKGWLRVILKQHHGELNWDFHDIPRLYDEAAQAGLDTLFIAGWTRGGFARMWPDYIVDDRMGGTEVLKEGINYIHKKGGHIFMFISYLLIDRKSEFYLSGRGKQATIKSYWDEEIPFSETYCGEGTYRKIGNPPMPMYYVCPGSDIWHEKMKETCRYVMELGADGIMFDLGGHPAYFCFDEHHDHEKPSQSFASKQKRYRELHELVRSYGDDRVTMMEDNIDIFAQHMDISQGTRTRPMPDFMLELYRYTLPECIMTNRECGQDEDNYLLYANYSFIYGLRFDMTIYRCCGSLSDIPNYAAYLKKINEIREKYAKYLLMGHFIDNEGFTIDNPVIQAKSYMADDGTIAVALWNPGKTEEAVTVVHDGKAITYKMTADSINVAAFGD